VANIMTARIAEGQGRNNALFQLVVTLRRGGLVTPESVQGIVQWWNDQQLDPLDPRELEATIKSAFRSRFSYGCEKDYMADYCERERCPIALAQARETMGSPDASMATIRALRSPHGYRLN
jgi:hypothetical protein